MEADTVFNRKLVFVFVILISLLLIMQPGFAYDNQTEAEVTLSSQDYDLITGNNDYYFNASAPDDSGDGSAENPYKYFTSSRIRANSNIYLAEGEYEFDKTATIEKVNIIGSNSSTTVLRFHGIAFNVLKSLTLTNITLVGITIENYGNLNITGCNLEYGAGNSYNYYGKNYGGAIYCPHKGGYSANVIIKDSFFHDNFAIYGGAIYMEGGRLEIRDSSFVNNTAYCYGGTIACELGTEVNILRTRISNSKSLSDAGGAVYLKKSSFEADYLNITNTHATFGSAITALKTEFSLSHSYFANNTAQFSGGAVFQMYAKSTLLYNKFINNSAKNGGALFIDNSDSLFLRMNEFTNNTASECAGAFYCLVNNMSFSPYYMNTFTNNHASENDDVYESDSFNMFLGNGNYTMYKVDSVNITEIPSRYSLVDENLVTSIKDQQWGGNCWAFAAIAALESCIIKAGGPSLDLSEENLKNLMALYGDYGWSIDDNCGGVGLMAIAYLTSWMGPVYDREDYYDYNTALSPIFNSTLHIQNVLFLNRQNYTDNDAVKLAVLKYGAVSTSMCYDDKYFRGNGHYCWNDEYENHAVCIVGWDDNYSAENFYGLSEGDGAWIVRNSWGTDWKDGGYFYVSYYDKVFAKPNNLLTTYTFILNDTVRFDKNYQYDFGGFDIFHTDGYHKYYKNVFNATDDEYLAAISTGFLETTNWTASVYVNNVLKTNLSGISPAGYYTFNLNDLIRLNRGDTFDVVFHITGNYSSFFFFSEDWPNNSFSQPGISFISHDGENWTDLYYHNVSVSGSMINHNIACIKAFTILNEINTTLTLNIEDIYLNSANITARITDQYGNIIKTGNVTFTVEGADYTVNISDGVARLTHTFRANNSLIYASFAKTGYIASDATGLVEIPQIQLDLSDSVIVNYRNATVQVMASAPVNETVILSIKGRNYTQKLINGIASFDLCNLGNDNYTFTLYISDNPFFKAEPITDSFEIFTDFNTTIALDIECDWVRDVNITATVYDQFGNRVLNGEVTFNLEGVDYALSLRNGTAFITHNFTSNSVVINATFTGFAYNSSHISQTLNIPKKSIVLDDSISISYRNATIEIFADKNINETVIISVNGNNQTRMLDAGHAALELSDLANDNYTVAIYLKDNIYYDAAVKTDSFEIFTDFNTTIALDIECDWVRDVNITARVTDQFGNPVLNGKITFTLEGNVYTVDLTDGEAFITHNFTSNSVVIDAEFAGFAYNGSHISQTLNIPKKPIVLSDFITISYRNATIEIIADKNINETVIVSLNGINQTEDLVNGYAIMNLTGLPNANYTVALYLKDNIYYDAAVKTDSFEIFTDFNTTIALDIECDWVRDVNITATVTDQFGNPVLRGKITFTLEGEVYTVDLTDGEALITHNFTANSVVIDAEFAGFAYNSSHISQTLNIPKKTIVLNDSITVLGRNVTIAIESDIPINETVIVSINGDNQTIDLKNGKTSLNLTGLENGNYTVNVYLNDNIYYESSVKDDIFEVHIRTTFIRADDLKTCYRSGVLYNITLVDEEARPVVGKRISITIDKSKTYWRTTDENGVASIALNLGIGSYSFDFGFEGDITHINSTASSEVTVKSSIETSGDSKYAYNSKYVAVLYCRDGVSVNNRAQIIVDGVVYNRTSNANGEISLNLCLKVGTHTIEVVNPETGEVKTQKIQFVSRITENRDVVKYYLGSQTYRVRAIGDNGNPVGAGEIVKITVCGKTYSRKTDSNGYASLEINLKPNTYMITAEYKGYKVSNKITVKPTLITSDMDVKKGTTIKYYAKLLDSTGKIQVNKLVSFKFNGKTYSAKTSSYGYAIVYIANSLKAGKYNVVSSYGTMTNINVITIR